MNWKEALEFLEAARKENREVELGADNPHWWCGWNKYGFWWLYSCCELCSDEMKDDYFKYQTIEELDKEHAITAEDMEWGILKS
jgi:hypothetical protein